MVKNPPCNAGDTAFNSWSGKIPRAMGRLSLCATTTNPALPLSPTHLFFVSPATPIHIYWFSPLFLLLHSRLCDRRRQWHPTLVLLPGKSHGWRSLVGCSPWGLEESDMTERLHFHFSLLCIGEGNGNTL